MVILDVIILCKPANDESAVENRYWNVLIEGKRYFCSSFQREPQLQFAEWLYVNSHNQQEKIFNLRLPKNLKIQKRKERRVFVTRMRELDFYPVLVLRASCVCHALQHSTKYLSFFIAIHNSISPCQIISKRSWEQKIRDNNIIFL